MIMNLYEPTKGSVLIDGLDTRQIDPTDLRHAIGSVPQEPFLFMGTIKDNLTIGEQYVSDEEFVKDCIQDLFVKLCSSTRLSPTDYVRSYLLTSLKNLIFDKLSSLKSTEDINALPFDLTIEDTSLEVLFKDNDEDIQMIKNLQEAYKQLSENQRMAIYLRYIKGLSYREVAAVLEINPQSAMNLVSRTLTSLRSKMTLKEYLFFLPFFLS